jgi:hypothetical protein
MPYILQALTTCSCEAPQAEPQIRAARTAAQHCGLALNQTQPAQAKAFTARAITMADPKQGNYVARPLKKNDVTG